MGTVPTVATFTAGGVVTSTWLNTVKSATDFLLSPPAAFVFHSASITLSHATYAVIPMGGEAYEVVQAGDSEMHSTSTNNSRVYVRTSGKWQISAQLGFAVNSAGDRLLNVRKNAAGSIGGGVSLYVGTTAPLTGQLTTAITPTLTVDLVAGDYVELFGRQNSGGNLATSTGAEYTFLQLRWVGV